MMFHNALIRVLILSTLLAAAAGRAAEKRPSGEMRKENIERLAEEMQRQTAAAEGLTYAALLDRYAHPYLDTVEFDAKTAEYYAGFVDAFGLNSEARSTLSRLGFVAVPSPSLTEWTWTDEGDRKEVLMGAGPTDVFYRVFAADLPLFISADAILHAWHRTFEAMMMNVEQGVYYDDLREILDKTIGVLDPAREDERDALFYLSTARMLLDGEGVQYAGPEDLYGWEVDETERFVPHSSVEDEVRRFIRLAHGRRLIRVSFMGRKLEMDFSQFIPRGYYTKSKRLTCYFLAMMWLGQTDLVLYNVESESVDAPREEAAARALARALHKSETSDLYRELQDFYTAVVGHNNTLSPTALWDACVANDSPDCTVLSAALRKAYAAATAPAYSSRVFDNEKSPLGLRFFPRRFAVDAWALSEVVAPKLKPDVPGGRAMAMDLDVAFALGSDRAVHYYEKEMKKPLRENLPAALLAVRKTLDAVPPFALEKSVYNLWLLALAELAKPSLDKRFPAAMRTAAYHDRKLEAVLAGWAELRHDTALAVEQSLGGTGCQYPKGYVEPVPKLYRALAEAAALTDAAFGETARMFCPNLMQAEDAAPAEASPFFKHWIDTMETLAVLAEKELAGEAMNETELQFLNKAVDLHLDPYNGERQYNGWYPELYWRDFEADVERSKPVVADVHTDAENGRVLQVGVGHPGLMIIAVDNGDDLSLFGGPVYNYHAFQNPLHRRMTDETWKSILNNGRAPEKPDFTKAYWVPNHPTKAVPDKPEAHVRRRVGGRAF